MSPVKPSPPCWKPSWPSCARAGFRIVVAHGHGPSTKAFMARAREWEEKFGLYLRWAWSEDDRIGFQTDHAAANETSIMMYFHPELVDMAALPQDPACRLEGISARIPGIMPAPDWAAMQPGKPLPALAGTQSAMRAAEINFNLSLCILPQYSAPNCKKSNGIL